MYKIKIIAPKYLIGPLALMGLELYPADSENEARSALYSAAQKKEPGLIFISERLAADLQADISKINQTAEINVVMIPDNQGSTGLAETEINNLVKNSIGAEVIIRQ